MQTHAPTDNKCLFLDMIPAELRDHIYDYVAPTEREIGLQITLAEQSQPKIHAYFARGLGHTCKQIRQEYSLRLQNRIQDLQNETRDIRAITFAEQTDAFHREHLEESRESPNYKPTEEPALDPLPRTCIVLVADRKVSKGVHVQDDVALMAHIPFVGIYDHGLGTSSLVLTVASSEARAYNDKYHLHDGYGLVLVKYLKGRGELATISQATSMILDLLRQTDWVGSEHWFDVWWKYNVLFLIPNNFRDLPPMSKPWMEHLLCLVGDYMKRRAGW